MKCGTHVLPPWYAMSNESAGRGATTNWPNAAAKQAVKTGLKTRSPSSTANHARDTSDFKLARAPPIDVHQAISWPAQAALAATVA
jgi:hypothetical protein